jgi:3-hydroxyacyl-[acyl-carrier-protein] dehydratase
MPPKALFDMSLVDTSRVVVSREAIYAWNPHRFEFQMLDGLHYINYDTGDLAGFRDVRTDEFWIRGHIPGRPLFPGVMMIETAAQLVSYYAMTATKRREFIGFSGVTDVRFRGAVTPGQRILMVGRMLEIRPRRCIEATQAYVNGEMVYEGVITGMWL